MGVWYGGTVRCWYQTRWQSCVAGGQFSCAERREFVPFGDSDSLQRPGSSVAEKKLGATRRVVLALSLILVELRIV